jgi:hypothetical protein
MLNVTANNDDNDMACESGSYVMIPALCPCLLQLGSGSF